MNSAIRVWVNDRLVDAGEPALLALDHGVTVGDGAFETAKIVAGRVFAGERHARRMERTLAGLGLPPLDHDRLRRGIEAVLAAGEPIAFGRLRYTITGGPGPLGSDRGDVPPTYIVTAAAMPRPPASTSVVTVPWTRNEGAATAGLKTTSYAENVIALANARERGGSEAIFGNTRGQLCEGTGSNIFVVLGTELWTPPLSDGPLAGITRELVLEWSREAGQAVREESLPLGALADVDEVFLTSSTRDVQPVDRVDGRQLTAPGPVTAEIAALFAQRAMDEVDA